MEGTFKTPSEMISRGNIQYIELMAKNRIALATAALRVGLPILKEMQQYVAEHRLSEDQQKAHAENWATEFYRQLDS